MKLTVLHFVLHSMVTAGENDVDVDGAGTGDDGDVGEKLWKWESFIGARGNGRLLARVTMKTTVEEKNG